MSDFFHFRALFCLLAFAPLSPTWAEEDEGVSFKAGINLGFRTLDFEQDFEQGALYAGGNPITNPADRSSDFHQSFRSVDYSFAMGWSRFYTTLNYETNLSAEDASLHISFTDLDMLNGPSTSVAAAPFQFDRDDYSLTLGWNAIDTFSLFTGYKSGTTETSRPTRTLNLLGAWSNSKVESKFQEAGPFVGASYNWPGREGVLTLSAAYAYMNGNYDESGNELLFQRLFVAPNPDVLVAVSQQAMSYDGHTDGLSINLSWNVLATDHLGYYYGFRWQRYSFDTDTELTWVFYNITDPQGAATVTTIPLTGMGTVSNSETISTFYAGVNYLF